MIIEVTTGTADYPALLPVYKEFLKNKLGITVQVELVAPGALSPLTGIETRQKPIRLLDRRM